MLALLALFVYFVVTGAMSMYYAGAIIRPPLTPVSPIDRNIAHPYTSVSFRSRADGLLLNGWHFNAKKTGSALIIVHGFGGNRFPFGEQTLDLVEAAIEIDFNVLAFDLRNSGAAERGISTFGLHEQNDVLGAIDFMKNAGYKNLALLGISTGANAAIIAGAKTQTEDVGALILDSPIIDIQSFIMRLVREKNPDLPEFPFNYMAPLLAGLYLNSDAHAADAPANLEKFMPRSVLLIHGNNDEIVSMADNTAMYDDYMSRAVGRISVWNVPGAGHGECFYIAKEEYLDRVTTFLRRVFS